MTKYKNIKCEYNGFQFDSKAEMNYYIRAYFLQKAGLIKSIELQPRFDYTINYEANGKKYTKKAFYKADFRIEYYDGNVEIVDVKGFETNIFKAKKKIIESLYGIKIKIVK
jgi:phosphate-selective porin